MDLVKNSIADHIHNIDKQMNLNLQGHDTPIDYAWYVDTSDGDKNDHSDSFIDGGYWENRCDNKFKEEVKSIRVGDRIALKSVGMKKKGLPFDNNAKWVRTIYIKATGRVTKNNGDGKHLDVDWEKNEPVKEWYAFLSLPETLHLVKAADGILKKQFLKFTFNGEQQDYSLCEEKYMDDALNDVVIKSVDTTNNELKFREWMAKQPSTKKDNCSPTMIASNCTALNNVYENIRLHPKRIFEISDVNSFSEIRRAIENNPYYHSVDKDVFGGFLNTALEWYGKFLNENGNDEEQKKYWILVTKPSKNNGWEFNKMEIGTRDTYNAKDNNVNQYQGVQKGDSYLGYVTERGIVAAGEITQGFDGKTIEFVNMFNYCNPITRKELFETKFVQDNNGVINKFLGSIFELTHDEYEIIMKMLVEKNVCKTEYKRNRIVFGAPGTGKSFKLQEDVKACIKVYGGAYERVTFHPDYTYSQFVGAYKPVSKGGNIEYKFVPGPFLRVYVEALHNCGTPHILLIEEINRARVAAVFGDVFQLLDRGGNGVSTYPIHTSEDIRNYLAGELGGSAEDYKEMRLPNNMFIWTTMNSADQGVFPMDTAFKRRWNFEYININDAEEKLPVCEITIGAEKYRWNDLRRGINNSLLSNGINEDKLLGPFFLSEETLENAENDSTAFNEIFKSKVIMYLFEDVMKMRPGKLFKKFNDMELIYSDICTCYDKRGIGIFTEETVKEIKGLKGKRNTSTVANQVGAQLVDNDATNQAVAQPATGSATSETVQQTVSDATDNQGTATN